MLLYVVICALEQQWQLATILGSRMLLLHAGGVWTREFATRCGVWRLDLAVRGRHRRLSIKRRCKDTRPPSRFFMPDCKYHHL